MFVRDHGTRRQRRMAAITNVDGIVYYALRERIGVALLRERVKRSFDLHFRIGHANGGDCHEALLFTKMNPKLQQVSMQWPCPTRARMRAVCRENAGFA